MINNYSKKRNKPSRVLILGGGFVSKGLSQKLKENKINFLVLRKKHLDLSKENSHIKLRKIIKNSDTLVFISAKAPVKIGYDFIYNISICNNVFNALKKKSIKHLVYISSDAVYSDSSKPLTEKSKTGPNSLHGLMHLTRENIIKFSKQKHVCILRPTLIYGKDDPHNGYGPNRFMRLAQQEKEIKLFGKGEEKRDHIHIDEVSNLILLCILHRSRGTLNLVTGAIYTFLDIAKTTIKINESSSQIKFKKRKGVMPHNGYRAFNNYNLFKAFKNFKFKSIEENLRKMI